MYKQTIKKLRLQLNLNFIIKLIFITTGSTDNCTFYQSLIPKNAIIQNALGDMGHGPLAEDSIAHHDSPGPQVNCWLYQSAFGNMIVWLSPRVRPGQEFWKSQGSQFGPHDVNLGQKTLLTHNASMDKKH